MFIFLAIVMGPGVWFMLYALSQFWREARRLRPRSGKEFPWSVTPVTSSQTDQWDHAHRAVGSEGNKGAGERAVVVITQPLSRRSIERDVA